MIWITVENIKFNPTSHNTQKINSTQTANVNVYIKTVKLVEENVEYLLAFKVGKYFYSGTEEHCP